MATSNMTHVFEKAGLGQAPFKFIGAEEKRGPYEYMHNGVKLTAGAPGQPMGICDYCGTGIALCCIIRSADGKEFIVGSSCVNKTGDSGLKRDVNRKKRELKRPAEEARIEKARAIWEANEAIQNNATKILHSKYFMAQNGWTQKNEIEFLLKNAGHSGLLRVARMIEKL